jgi:putative DNA primase/helicase
MTLDKDELKRLASGRWIDVLEAVGGIERNLLDGRHHPCPKCGGTDRFRMTNTEDGAVYCNQCFSEKNGDGLAAIQWMLDGNFPMACRRVGEYLGVSGNGHINGHRDIVADIARRKSVPLKSWKAFGAAKAMRGKLEVCRLPMFDEVGEECSSIDFATIDDKFLKGMTAKGKPVGLFLEHGKLPTAGETVHIVEGPKDAAVLHGLGVTAVGLPTSEMATKLARGFRDVHVVIIPDRDQTGEKGAQKTAGRLAGVAASVKTTTLPGELRAKDGADVRDVLKKPDGEKMIRQAIADAMDWQPDDLIEQNEADSQTSESLANPEGRTDVANARRFVAQHGDNVRYCHPWKKWLVWDGRRWKVDDSGAVTNLAKSTADAIWDAAKSLRATREAIDFAVKSANASSLRAMLSLAMPDVSLRSDDMDSNDWILNCANGTIDLKTGMLREHWRQDNLTQLCPTKFIPDASSEVWDEFLASVFDGDQDISDFLRRFVGYALTGDVSEQMLPIFHGGGANGKSTFLNALMELLGNDYSMQAPHDMLIVKGDAHPTERADLFCKRFVSAVETEQGRSLNEALVKQLTGGERVRARRMREDFWEFDPTHKIVICTNHRPQINGTDHAIWRRIKLIPFTVTFADDKQDKNLPDKLREESEGILAWAVRGCLEWQAKGLLPPDAISAATADYRTEQDPIGRFINERCLTIGTIRVKFSDLYAAFEEWCKDGGEPCVSKKLVGEYLQNRGYERKVSNGKWYLGITLKAETT